MAIPAKVLAHVTEVSFGEVSARWTPSWKWCVFDARPVRQGAVMLSSEMEFEAAICEAYSVSTREPTK